METLKCLLFQWYRLRRIVTCSRLVLATNWVSSAQAAYVDALVAPDLFNLVLQQLTTRLAAIGLLLGTRVQKKVKVRYSLSQA